MEVALSWYGPFVLFPQSGIECVFDREEMSGPGIYLWTVEVDDGYLINYVGETGRDLWSRLTEDVSYSFGGQEKVVVDPEQFRQGSAVIIASFSVPEFLADYQRLSSLIYEVYRAYRLFIIPTSVSNDVRKYIEAGIIRELQTSKGKIADFLSNKRLIGLSPEQLSARFVTKHQFHGLGEVIKCSQPETEIL